MQSLQRFLDLTIELFHLKCSQFDSINNDYICVGCGPLRIEPPADDDDICPVCDGVCNCKNGFTAEAPYALGFTLDPISPLKRKRNPSRRVAVVKNTRPPPKRDVKRCGKTHLPPVGINSIYDSDDSFSDLFGDDYERKDLHHSEVDSDFMDADDLETLFRIDDDRLLDGYNDLEDDDSDNDPMGEDELVEQLVYTGWSSDDESDGGSDMAFLFDTFQTPATSEVSVSDDDDDELKATNLFELKAPSEKTADTESLLDGQEVSDFEENYDSDIFDPKSSKEVASIDPKLIHSPFVSPAFSYDVKKDQVGPNGEIISTTKTMKFKVRPKKLVKIDTKAKKTPILPPKKLTHLTAPLPKGFKPQSSKTAPTASTTLAIQAAAASILKSCGLPITTSNTGENTAYASLASINPFAAAMAMVLLNNLDGCNEPSNVSCYFRVSWQST